MGSVAKALFGNLTERPELSATVTVVAMLIAGTLAKLEFALWGIAVIGALCLLHIALQAKSILGRNNRAPRCGGRR
jgi:hypothetical protein